jgi:hypothetical protein
MVKTGRNQCSFHKNTQNILKTNKLTLILLIDCYCVIVTVMFWPIMFSSSGRLLLKQEHSSN